VVLFVGVGKLADMLFGPSSEIVVLSKYFWFNILLVLVLAGTAVVANLVLIPRYGINGAAMGVAFALTMFNAIKYVFVWMTLGIQPFSRGTLIVLVIGTATVGLNYVLPVFDNMLVDLVVRSGVVTVFYGGAVLVTKVSPDVNEIFRKGLRLVGL
jgi:O-antigen/teichoic acid export membrane protein